MPSTKYDPKKYFDNGRVLLWGEDLSPEASEAMLSGEIFTLLDPDGEPHRKVLKDTYNQIRERDIGKTSPFDSFLGLPGMTKGEGSK